MKLKLLLSLPLVAISLSSCTLLTRSSSISVPKKEIEKTKLVDTANDLTDYSIYLTDSLSHNGGKVLVIPVWFSDSASFIEDKEKTKNDISKAFFGTNKETGWRSVKTYYEEESLSKFKLEGCVTDWYEIKKSSSYFTDGEKTNQLVKDAVNYFKANVSEEEYNSFDTDKNGYLDAVALIYGANHTADKEGGNDNLWAYTFWLQDHPDKDSPKPNTFLWASFDFMYTDVNHCTIDAHTYIHEFGHILGLEDYYDYNSEHGSEAAGYFSMQDYNVGMHDPFSTLEIGWNDPYIIKESMTIDIKPFTTSGDMILLANHDVVSPFDEYVLLELYTTDGLNQFDSTYNYRGSSPTGPRRYGIRMWHVDARLITPYTLSGGKPLYKEQDIATKIDRSGNKGFVLLETNSTYSSDFAPGNEDYLPKLSGAYYNYKLLSLVRNSDYTGVRKGSPINDSDLFHSGDVFRQTSFHQYFPNRDYMDENRFGNKSLGWEIYFDNVSETGATITLVKLIK